MTKLPRVTAKIFASDAAPNDIGQFGSALTGTKVSTGDIAEIQSLAAYKTGWRAAVISKRNYPTLQEMNGVQKTFSQQIAYNLQEGIAEYDPNTTYYKGSIVKALNSEEIPVLYYSLIDENVGNALDSENWAVLSVGGGGGTGSAGLNLFDTVFKDHILSFEESKGLALQGTYVYKNAVAGSRYGYPDFYNECVAQKNAATETTLTVGETTITTYKNSNGHIFYDIANKAAIDEIYNNTGTAWYYGVDTANERIFLPRNDNFVQCTGNTADVGKFIEAGLPNITGTIKSGGAGSDWMSGAFTYLNSENNGNSGRHDGGSDANYVSGTAEFNASNSNSIYGKSDTVQPPAVKKLVYMVVGNTEVTSSITDVTEITTSENDTIPLFTAQYFEFTPNNPSWLKAGEQKNSGGIYTTAYNTLVNCLTDNIYNLKVVETADMTAGVDYSEYWKVDQTNMTFTTPTKISYLPINSDTAPVIGNGMTLGLNNGIQNAGLLQGSNGALFRTGIYGKPIGTNDDNGVSNGKSFGITTDPDKSGLVADLSSAKSTTAQLYFKVANAVENLELLDAGEVLESLATKTDMAQASNASMPSSKNIVLTLGTSGMGYTAPTAGWLALQAAQTAASGWFELANTTSKIKDHQQSPSTNDFILEGFIPCAKGDVVQIYYGNISPKFFSFIYAEGAKND